MRRPVTECRLLGAFSLCSATEGGSTPVVVSPRKARALIAYLAMHAGEPVERERLADLLWSDVSDGDARHNLRQCIVTLKRLRPDLLIVKRSSVALAVDPASVDVLRFAELIAARR